jgi:hypothetical protein
MNIELRLEFLNRSKTAIDNAIDAFEKLREQKLRRRKSSAMENLIQQRDAIDYAIIRMQDLDGAMGNQAAAPANQSR